MKYVSLIRKRSRFTGKSKYIEVEGWNYHNAKKNAEIQLMNMGVDDENETLIVATFPKVWYND